MKKLLSTIILCLCVLCGIQAQTIRKGDKFFDGATLYTVQEVRMGSIVYMTSNDDEELTLEKVNGKTGEYTITPSRQAEEPPFGSEWGGRVQYIRQDGMNFLAFREPDGSIFWTMVLTPNTYDECIELQRLLGQEPPINVVQNTLINRHYLSDIPKEELRLLRNSILARHGYRFQSKDLQEYFSQQSWYKPGTNNAAIKLNIIEQTNVELIKSAEATR